MMNWLTLYYQNQNNLNMINLNSINFIITLIIMTIMLILINKMLFININNYINKSMNENQFIETMWTMLPLILISMIMKNSIMYMYMNNENKLNLINIKILGNQWFWNYEYKNFNKLIFSYMKMINNFDFKFLETDNSLIIPLNSQINLILSSSDVIHSWTVPSLNIKMDAIPSQINLINFKMLNSMISFGQCSEICGMYHSFMPIKIESINLMMFLMWLKKYFW